MAHVGSRMRLTAASKDELLLWAADYLEAVADDMSRSYFSPNEGRIVPREIQYEVRKLHNWIKRAKLLAHKRSRPTVGAPP